MDFAEPVLNVLAVAVGVTTVFSGDRLRDVLAIADVVGVELYRDDIMAGNVNVALLFGVIGGCVAFGGETVVLVGDRIVSGSKLHKNS